MKNLKNLAMTGFAGGGATDIGSQSAKEEYAKEFEKSREEILRADALRMTGTANAALLPSPLEGERICGRTNEVSPDSEQIEQTLTRISKFAALTKKFNPLLIQARVNKTLTSFSPFTSHVSRKRAAFTLAEVLITLGIIGVVAAMTMPTLITKNQEKVTVAKLKKMNSVLNNAFLRAVNEYGTPDNWNIISRPDDVENEEAVNNYYNSVDNVMNKFLPFLKTTYVCYASDTSCDNSDKYTRDRYNLNGQIFGQFSTPKIILADGSSIETIYFGVDGCNMNSGTSKALRNFCGEIVVDINGTKAPNAQGKDIFWFYLTKYGIVPAGADVDTLRPFDEYCNLSKTDNLNGYGCTAWVIYNENMDYLKCNDLSWDGKKKCK